MAQARGYFERALALDAGNIDALVGIASVDFYSVFTFMSDDRASRAAAAEAALTKVLLLAPNHALAQHLLGAVYILTNRAAEGIAKCEHALALDRNLADAHGVIGVAKMFTGRAEETESHVLEALRLSPRDTTAPRWMAVAGFAKLYLGREEEAVAWFRRAIETNRNNPVSHLFLAAALAQLGRMSEARSATEAGLALDPTFTIRRFRASASSDNPTYLAQRERAFDALRKAGVPEG
jgi:tetratricopeptide (TPR) repeat protein